MRGGGRGRERRKERRGERKREEKGEEGGDGGRERITGRSVAGSSSFIPTHAGVLQGVRGRALAGAAGARIWPPLFSATVPSSSFSSRDVDLQVKANHCLTTNMRRRFYECAFHLNLESYFICRGHFWWNSMFSRIIMDFLKVVVGVARHVPSGFSVQSYICQPWLLRELDMLGWSRRRPGWGDEHAYAYLTYKAS
ncbi:uncharacterized protein [Triticum aestivum]|uniref:uncharacterized protein n=1 Tax=Triticum aestivum TaxID=4565 RepID=UPI001D0219F4|nr:uncharacterized protein LOC123110442 [Triticum aestivum]